MPADQWSRLDAAATGGYVLGGAAAVPEAKVAARNLTRLGGATRWETAQLIGSQARALAAGQQPDTPNVPDTTLSTPSDVQQPGVFLHGAEPWIASDCAGDVPIVVGSDSKAQSDIYSAVTLAGVVDTDCVVLAGPRDGDMPASQRTRLAAAEAGGYVLGGTAAVPTAKIAGRDMTRLGGNTRWATAQLVGRRASGDTTVGTSTAAENTGTADVSDSTSARFTAVSAGEYHTCGLRTNGTVSCWGLDNSRGVDAWGLGTGGQIDAPSGEFTAISVAKTHSCGLRANGAMVCWGFMILGLADVPRDEIIALATGRGHSCGLRANNTIACWGSNDRGQTATSSGQFITVSAGDEQTCGLHAEGTATCWGEVADGTIFRPGFLVPYRLPDGTHATIDTQGRTKRLRYNRSAGLVVPSASFKYISAGGSHACGLRANGTMICWGLNRFAQSDTPSGTFTAIAAGDQHTCAVRTNGEVTCWGLNYHGQADAPSGSFTAVSAGERHSCGVRIDATITCWGDNHFGQATAPAGGFAAVYESSQEVCGLRPNGEAICFEDRFHDLPSGRLAALSVGDRNYSCGVRTNGEVTCWGADPNGHPLTWRGPKGTFTEVTVNHPYSCGVRTSGTLACWRVNFETDMPHDVPSGTFAEISAAGANSWCGLRTNGTVSCWGNPSDGRTDAPSGKFTAVYTGSTFACGLRTNGRVSCWGSNVDGESDAPSGSFTSLALGGNDAVGLRTDGSVVIWGAAVGHIDTDRNPRLVEVLSGKFSAVSTHCGVHTNGTANCWLPVGSSAELPAPQGKFTSISHSCGIRTSGTLVCWGNRPLRVE